MQKKSSLLKSFDFFSFDKKMKAEKLKELKARNVLVENIFEKMRNVANTESEILHWTSSLERLKECGTRQYKTQGAMYKCRSKYCRICLSDERHKRYNKILNAFEVSEKKLEKGYVEAFLTLNYDYTSDKVKNMKIAEYLKYFQKMFQKFKKELEKQDCLGYIYKKEFPYVCEKFQLHYHVWICIKQENLLKLQQVWQEITQKNGNLHLGSCEEYQIYKYYKCDQLKRNSKIEVEKIANYLAKSYLSVTEAQKNTLVENIEDEKVLEELIKKTDRQLENFRCLNFCGIFDVAKSERERKSERSRMFIVQNYSKEKFENEKDYLNAEIYANEDTLLLKFKSNNNSVKDVEERFGGKVTTLKGRGIWKDTIEMGDFKEVKRIGMKNKKPIVKKTPVTTEKVETFEIFGNIEEIKQKIINGGNGAMAWATELVQVILPYTNLKQQSSDEDKQTIKKLEAKVEELQAELQGFIEKKQGIFSDEKQSEKSDFIVIQNENEMLELEEYKMETGGGYCYITRDKKKCYVNTMYAKKYDKKSFKAERIEHYTNFEEFNKKYHLKKTF